MNVYDVVLDFILLDAFDELKDPPTTLLNVLRNRWLSESLKVSVSSTLTHSLTPLTLLHDNHKYGCYCIQGGTFATIVVWWLCTCSDPWWQPHDS